MLTGYLGTGTTFGVTRLEEAFANRKPADPPAHIIIVTDLDIFGMLDTSRGKRPGFSSAAPPERARELYERFAAELRERYAPGQVQTGRFGADMAVALVNDGPVTFLLER